MDEIFKKIQKAIHIEIEALEHFHRNLSPEVSRAIEMILQSSGKLILTGVGKSGDIAKKISSTLSSTGTSSVFLHPTDAVHGDAGVIQANDIVMAIGKSGESDELVFLIQTVKKIGAKVISITANPESRLAHQSDITLVTPVLMEACPYDLAPTSSTTIALVLGDAMAMTLMELKNFKEDNFALYHPSGRLGKRLSLQLSDVMRKAEKLAYVYPDAELEDIINEISQKFMGATAVVDEHMKLLGFITDFDIRKCIQKGNLKADLKAREIMTLNPISFPIEGKAYDVLLEMEGRERPISVAPVIDSEGKLAGIVLLHDLLQYGLK
ncbi:MAG: KpsF/GutQ family sugar-phosphate isomerase [Leptospiraceae bacterium]|nr:KpsF/GutQ family sugar-phosphate isomerase [Leptospiraceae bacterium]MCP5498395.1 KpsF/GutQ family sugar-phosphate isomerase [Leptospiraceae bacterium]